MCKRLDPGLDFLFAAYWLLYCPTERVNLKLVTHLFKRHRGD